VPAAGVSRLAYVRRASRSGFATEWLKRGSSTDSQQAGVPPWFPTNKEAEMKVMIGIDPHKASHTAVAIDRDEDQIASVKVRATNRQVEQLLCWAEPFEKRA
jgi:hypothetical protein